MMKDPLDPTIYSRLGLRILGYLPDSSKEVLTGFAKYLNYLACRAAYPYISYTKARMARRDRKMVVELRGKTKCRFVQHLD